MLTGGVGSGLGRCSVSGAEDSVAGWVGADRVVLGGSSANSSVGSASGSVAGGATVVAGGTAIAEVAEVLGKGAWLGGGVWAAGAAAALGANVVWGLGEAGVGVVCLPAGATNSTAIGAKAKFNGFNCCSVA